MKSFVTISLIILFVVSQYAKQLSYLECKISNALTTTTASCDCETINDMANTGDMQLPYSPNHTHYSIDEYYTTPFAIAQHIFIPGIDKQSMSNSPDVCKGNYYPPYHPPRS